MRNVRSNWFRGLLAFAAAASLCGPQLTATPVSPMRRWFESAQSCARHGQYEKALGMYSKLMDDWRRKPELHTAIGDAQMGLKRYDEAVASYRTAIACSPKHVPARLDLARALAAQGDRDAACKELNEVTRLAPRCEESHLLRSRLLREQGRPREALPVIQAALAFRSGSVEGTEELARVYLALGRGNDAIAAAVRAVSLKPRWAGTHALLATAYEAGKQAEKAVPELECAARLAPDDISVHEQLASLYELLGMAQKAATQRALLGRLKGQDKPAESHP
jgi:tetratricopeptide (TPR) repeat protein